MSALDTLNPVTPAGNVTVSAAPANTPADPIASIYQTTLGRAPDAGGLAYWQNALNSGTSLADIQNAISSSQEAQAIPKQNIDQGFVNPYPVVGGGGGGLPGNSGAAAGSGSTSNSAGAPQFTDAQVASYIKSNNLSGSGVTDALSAFGVTPDQFNKAQALINSNDPSIANATAAYNTAIAANPALASQNLAAYNPATATGALTNTAPNTATLTADPNAPDITQAYMQYLGRSPDASGLQYWEQAAANGTPISQIKAAIAASQEAKTLATPTPGNFTDAQVASYIKSNNLSGTSLANAMNAFAITPDQLTKAQALIAKNDPSIATATTAYNNAIATNPNSVTQNNLTYNPTTGTGELVDIGKLYTSVLGRAPDAAGLAYWTQQAQNGVSLDQIRSGIANSQEGTTASQIARTYQDYTGTLPTAAQLAAAETQLNSGKTIDDIRKGLAANTANATNIQTSLTKMYNSAVGQDPDPTVLANITKQIQAGTLTLADAAKTLNATPEAQAYQNDPVVQDYQQYLGRTPTVAESATWRTQLANGTSPADIAKGIALSPEGIKYSTNTLTAILTAQVGADFVKNLTPDQIKQYATTLADPSTAGSTTDQKLQNIYNQIAQDPTLGPKLKASSPELYAAMAPLQNVTGAFNGGVTGTHGTLNVNGVDVPILSAQYADSLLGNTQTRSNFSNTISGDLSLGWAGGGYSGNISKGADVFGVTKDTDENGSVSYSGDMNAAATALGIDPKQFKDITTPTVDANGKPTYQTDGDGNVITDSNGKPIQDTKIVLSAQEQLYNAINDASQNLYSFTGANLDQNAYNTANSFQTTVYKKVNDKLIPITAPQAHQGIVAMPSQGGGWSDFLPAIEMIGMVALAATGVGAAAAAEIGAAVVGEAGTVAGGIIGGAAVGAATGAALAALNGGDVGHGALMGAIGGGVGGTMNSVVTNIVPDSVINGVSGMTNLTPVQVTNAISSAFSSALVTTAAGANSTQIIKSLGISLVASGLSQSAANEIKAQFENMDPKQLEQVAKATQLATSTLTTSVLSGKNTQQITQSLINTMLQGSGTISRAGDNVALDINGRDQGTTGFTTGGVDQALTQPIIDQNAINLANASNDQIATMNAVKNWTGEAKDNLTQATGVMLNQGMDAATISQNLQDFYKIPADEATKYAEYMVDQSKQLVGPVKPTTTSITTPQVVNGNGISNTTPSTAFTNTANYSPTTSPVSTVNQMNWNGQTNPALATTASNISQQFNPNLTTSGNQYTPNMSNLGYIASLGGGATTATMPNMFGGGNYSLPGGGSYSPVATAAKEGILSDAAMASARGLGLGLDLMAYSPTLNNNEAEQIRQMYEPAGSGTTTLPGRAINDSITSIPGKSTTEGYGGIPFNPANNVETPTPFRGEAAPAPEGFAGVPNLPGATPAGDVVTTPANDPHVWDPTAVPNAPTFTPAGDSITASPTAPKPGQVPVPIVPPIPGQLPTTQPVTPSVTRPDIANEPAVTTQTNTETAVTPQVQTAIQTVARTQAEAQSLTQAVPLVENLISQNIARPIAISTVATQVNVPVLDLTKVIDVAVPQVVPDVTVPTTTTTTTTTPTTKTPVPTTKTPVPTTTAGNTGLRSPYQTSQYGGIQNLAPGLTAGGDYTLSGLSPINETMSPTQQYPQFPMNFEEGLPHFAAGSTTTPAATSSTLGYNPFSTTDPNSSISGSLTPGLTKAQLGYMLTGALPGHAAGGEIEGHNPTFFSEGGLESIDNRYVQGEGDGTSDSVAAMLANGEFVIPADVVSKLGNGSNEAGAGVLDQFLKVVRTDANSNGDKLPPKSKGALAYLLDAKRTMKA